MINTGYSLKAIAQRFREGIYSKAELDTGALDEQYARKLGSIGNINNPLVDWPLANSLTLKQGAGSPAFTRTSTATYIDRYGILQYVAANEPRFEKEGLLIEGGSTNLLTYSADLTNAVWSTLESSLTVNAITAPDGTLTAAALVDNTVNTSHSVVTSPVTTSVGVHISFSFFVKAGTVDAVGCTIKPGMISGWQQFAFNMTTKTFSAGLNMYNKSYIELPNGWFRISVTLPIDQVETGNIRINPYSGGSHSYVGTGEEAIYIWGAQLEEQVFATSYIPTTSMAVDRTIEICKLVYKGNAPTTKLHEQTVVCDFDRLGDLSENQFVYSVSPTSILAGSTYCNAVTEDKIVFIDKVSDYLQMNKLRIGVVRVAQVRSEITNTGYQDGEYIGETATGTTVVLPDGTGHISVGSRNNAYTLFGHVKNFRLYDQTLTADEIRVV